jgi:hypothetical protein
MAPRHAGLSDDGSVLARAVLGEWAAGVTTGAHEYMYVYGT